jgi:AcrR family transcriptional regulator
VGRAAKYSEDQILDAAASLLVEGGAAALTASGVARALSAPSGSLYHRYASRDHLAAALWMRTVERFDAEVVAALAGPGDPLDLAVDAARRMIAWSRDNPVDAFVLTMFRREDLTDDDMPDALAARARALGERQARLIEQLAERLGRPTEMVTFAVAGIPLAAVRGYISDRAGIPGWMPDSVERAVRAALEAPTTTGAQNR